MCLHEVWHAIYDLETELKHYETKPYSFGKGHMDQTCPSEKKILILEFKRGNYVWNQRPALAIQ